MSDQEWIELGEYESIRVNGPTHGGRYGSLPGVVSPSREQRLTLISRGSYLAFKLFPAGTEFPVTAVSCAVPKSSPMGAKRRRTKGSTDE